jgi:hypothetical protein
MGFHLVPVIDIEMGWQFEKDECTGVVAIAGLDRLQSPVEMPSQPVGQGTPTTLVRAFQVDPEGLVQSRRILEKAFQFGAYSLRKSQRFEGRERVLFLEFFQSKQEPQGAHAQGNLGL